MAFQAVRGLQPALRQQQSSMASSSLMRTARPAMSCLHTSAVRRANIAGVPTHEGPDPQLGDYRNPPFESRQLRKHDPRWWDKQEKANFGETLHEQDDVASVWAPDIHAMSPHKALLQLLLALGTFGGVTGLIYISLPGKPAQPRTFPRDGLKEEIGFIAAPAYGAYDAAAGGDEEEGDDEDDE